MTEAKEKTKNFAHLHLHTCHSVLDGLPTPEEVVVKAKRDGAVAITDHGNVSAIPYAYDVAKKTGVKLIAGEEFYVIDDLKNGGYYHLVVLAKNEEGLRNLFKLSSFGYLKGFHRKPRITYEELKNNSDGLIVLTACEKGEVPWALLRNDFKTAERRLRELREVFGGDLYVEIQGHSFFKREDKEREKYLNGLLVKLSETVGVPLVATNDVHYLEKSDYKVHDVLLCVQGKKTLTDKNRLTYPSDDYHFKTAEELAKNLSYLGDSVVSLAFDGVDEVVKKVNGYPLLEDRNYKLPKFTDNEDSLLAEIAFKGLEEKLSRRKLKIPKEKYYEQLKYELEVIKKMGFSGYFLIVWDFIRWAKENGVPVGPGRGSAVGSMTTYALDVTVIDPLEYGLIFERFLNPDRVSMPDIDVDFCKRSRDEVINYVRQKWGTSNVARIATFNRAKIKTAIKDVARAYGLKPTAVSAAVKDVPDDASSWDQVLSAPSIVKAKEKDSTWAEVLKVAQKIEGTIRSFGLHAAGVVISPIKLDGNVPLFVAKGESEKDVAVQVDMVKLEELGYLKMDFLGLDTITVIFDAFKLIYDYEKVKYDYESVPLNDEKTYELLEKGDTVGVFQLESSGMKKLLSEIKPRAIEDLTALLALYRPGPLQSGITEKYVKRRKGLQPVIYEFEELKPVLEETYGLPIYQEQIMKIAVVLAGYTMSEADNLRKAMGKKKKDLMAKHKEKFIAGAVAKGYPRDKVEKLYEEIAKFAEYGFNKSHSTAYAFISYLTAFLKANYPLYFYTALFNVNYNKQEKLFKYVKDAREHGFKLIMPDVNESDVFYKPLTKDSIMIGLAGVKGIEVAVASKIVEERNKNGYFVDLKDFLERTEVNKKVAENLIKAGAFDFTGKKRTELLSELDQVIKQVRESKKKRKRKSNVDLTVGSLFEVSLERNGGERNGEGERISLETARKKREEVRRQLTKIERLFVKDVLGDVIDVREVEVFKELSVPPSEKAEEMKLRKLFSDDYEVIGEIVNYEVKKDYLKLFLSLAGENKEVFVRGDDVKKVLPYLAKGNVLVFRFLAKPSKDESSLSLYLKSVHHPAEYLKDYLPQITVKIDGSEEAERLIDELASVIIGDKGKEELPPRDVVVVFQVDDSVVAVSKWGLSLFDEKQVEAVLDYLSKRFKELKPKVSRVDKFVRAVI